MTTLNEIVIARHAESLDWVADIPDAFNVIIYNKGQDLPTGPATQRTDRINMLANNGRESDTFLRHTLAKDEFGGGFTVFLQGNPFEHSPDILALLAMWREWQDIQPLSWRWLGDRGLPPATLLAREQGAFLSGARVRPELFSLQTWGPLQFDDPGAAILGAEYRMMHGRPEGTNIAADFLERCGWLELAEQARTHLVGRFSYGGLFAVRQQRLASLPRGSLEHVLAAANAHHMYGYVIERLWLHMCGEPFLLPAPAHSITPSDAAQLDPRFVPSPVPQPAHRRALPALKRRLSRRVSRWAQG